MLVGGSAPGNVPGLAGRGRFSGKTCDFYKSCADIRRGSLVWSTCHMRVWSSKIRLFSVDRYICRMNYVLHWLYISKFTRLRAVSRRQHSSCCHLTPSVQQTPTTTGNSDPSATLSPLIVRVYLHSNLAMGSERQAHNVTEGVIALQRHPRSSIFVPIESACSYSY